jgi:hypothetical protein
MKQILKKSKYTLSIIDPIPIYNSKSRDSPARIVMGYRLDGWGSSPDRGKRFFSSLQLPDRLWGPHNLIYNGYRRALPRWPSARDVKLTTHLYLMPK